MVHKYICLARHIINYNLACGQGNVVGNLKSYIEVSKLSVQSTKTYRVVLLTGPPLNCLSTGSHANWPGISLSVSSCKGILYLENLGGGPVKRTTLYIDIYSEILYPEGHQNRCISSKVTAILLNKYILPTGGASSGRVCACSLRSRLV